jgi:small subunit ribosomal protein S21
LFLRNYYPHFNYLGLIFMPSVKVRAGEPIDKALRALKKKLDKEGIMKAAKAHRFYDKPSVKSRAKSKAALKYKKVKTPRPV